MEEPRFPKTKEGETEPQWDQENAHRFFDVRGIVQHEFVPESQNVNAEFYSNVLCRLRVDIR
jgi:hypothetical protein